MHIINNMSNGQCVHFGYVDSMRTNSGRFKSRTITAIAVAIPLRTQHCNAKEKPGRLMIRIMHSNRAVARV